MLTDAALQDASLFSLPHPVRVKAVIPDYLSFFKQLTGDEWPVVDAALADESKILPAALQPIATYGQCPQFARFMEAMGFAPACTEQGAAYAIMDYLRFIRLQRPHFVIEDSLVDLLTLTDIAEDIPVSYLTPPYPGLYVELGKTRGHNLVVPNVDTGDHVLEGAYIEVGAHWTGHPAIHILLVGSPLGKENALDDATCSLVLDLRDPNRSLAEVLDAGFDEGEALSHQSGLRATPAQFRSPAREACLMMAKVLLYLNMPDVRRETHAERAQAEKALTAVKSTAKRAKAARRLGKLYDYVLISAPAAARGTGSVPKTAGHGVKSHWRRGHLRMQAHGPAHALRKLIHIAPVWVGQPGESAAPVIYRVR